MSKSIDTLVPDIQKMLENVVNGKTTEVDPTVMAEFGVRIAFKLEKALTARTKPRPPKTLYMSEYGKPCRRQVWYGLRPADFSPEPLPADALVKFLYGDILEEVVLAFAHLAGHKVTDEQKECEIELPFGWKLRGRMDAKIDGTLIDVKSASTQAFKKFKDNKLAVDDPFGYIKQLDGYAAHEGCKTGGFVAIEKQLGHLCYLPVENLPNAVLDTAYATELVMDMEGTMPPARAFEAEPMGKSGNMKLQTGCSYCGYKRECWKDANSGKGLRTFMYSNGPVFLTEVVKAPDVAEIK